MRISIGLIVEIPTSKGLAYGQYTHKIPDGGSVVRLFQGLYPERPDIEFIANLPLRFTIEFPLGAALYHKDFVRVGKHPVRSDLQPFPVFRMIPLKHLGEAKPKEWVLWDGENYLGLVPSDSPLCKRIPHLRSWSLPDLIERLESDKNDEMILYGVEGET